MNKWQFMIVVAVALTAGLIGGVISDRLAMATGKNLIEAREFRVVDEDGKMRIALYAHKHDTGITIFDSDGWVRIALDVSKAMGTGLIITNVEGKPQISIGADVRKNAPGNTVDMYDAKGTIRASMRVDEDGPSIALTDVRGSLRNSIRVNKDGPSVALTDAGGKLRATLGTIRLGEPRTDTKRYRAESSLVLLNRKGKVLFEAP